MASARPLNHLAGLRSGVAADRRQRLLALGRRASFGGLQRIAQQGRCRPALGFTMARSEIAPPIVSPYVWSANRDGATVTLQAMYRARRSAPQSWPRRAPSPARRDRHGPAAAQRRRATGLCGHDVGGHRAGRPADRRRSRAVGNVRLDPRRGALGGARDEAIRRASALPSGFTLEKQEITAARFRPTSGRRTETAPP